MNAMQFEPMTVGQIIDKTFKLWRSNFIRFAALISVMYIPLFVIQFLWRRTFLVPMSADGQPEMGPFIISTIVTLILAIVGQNLASAALMKSISQSYLGKQTSVGQAYRTMLPRLLAIILASILVALVVGVGFLLLVVPGIIFSLWFSLTIPVLILEGTGASKSMSRSKDLVSGNLGRVFGLGIVVVFITGIIGWIFGFIGGVIGIQLVETSPTLAQFLASLFSLIGQVMALPISAAAYILLYYDLRIRKEGFDLEMLAQSLGEEAPAADEPPAP
jgi:hypothetical protein